MDLVHDNILSRAEYTAMDFALAEHALCDITVRVETSLIECTSEICDTQREGKNHEKSTSL